MKKMVKAFICLLVAFSITTMVYAYEDVKNDHGIIVETVQVCPEELLYRFFFNNNTSMMMAFDESSDCGSWLVMQRIKESMELGKPIYWGAVYLNKCILTDEVTYYQTTCIVAVIDDVIAFNYYIYNNNEAKINSYNIVPFNRFSTSHFRIESIRFWDGVIWHVDNLTSTGVTTSIQVDLIRDLASGLHYVQDTNWFNGVFSPRSFPGSYRWFDLVGQSNWTRSVMNITENGVRRGPFTSFN